jgi:hypothetical protein
MTAAAIIIGCWQEHQQSIHQEITNEIISFINTNHDINTILISAEHNKITEENQGHNNWYNTEKRIFYDEQGVTWIRNHFLTATEKRNRLAFSTPCESILNYNWKNKNCISISEQWQLEYLLTRDFKNINQLWYFGIGWNLGVKQSGIGWGQLCDLVAYNHIVSSIQILTNRKCVAENLEPYSGKHFTQCQFAYPDFDRTEWKEKETDIYIKTNWQWTPG